MLFRFLLVGFPFILAADAPPGLTIQTVAGTAFVGDGGAATAAIFSQPQGIAVDASGNIYVADADDNRVREFTVNGAIQTVAGTGIAGNNAGGGPGTAVQLNHPYGLAVDAAGNLFIADLGSARIRKLTPDGTLSTFAGGGSTVPGSGSEGASAITIQLSAPRNVAVDTLGNVYIADFQANQIYRVTPGGVFSTFAGTGKAGFSGDNGSPKLAQLSSPAGLAMDTSGTLYIADSGNGRIRKVTAAGVISTVFSISGPVGLAVNSKGILYVAAAGYFGTTAHAVGTGIVARDVAADAAGNLYLTSGPSVNRLAPDGTLTIAAGSGASRYYGGDGGPAALARLHTPSSIAQDDLGNVYIADTDNNRIRKIMASGVMTTFAGTGQAGVANLSGAAGLAQLNAPRSVALDSLRNLYIADTGNNRVCKVTPGGALSVIAQNLNDPEAIAIDANDVLYIADTGDNQVLKVNGTTAPVKVVDALKPAGLAIDNSGTLFISETSRVSKIPSGGVLTTALDGLKNPRGLALTPAGDLIVAETGGHRIRLLSVAGVVSTIGGTGVPGFSGDGGPATAAQLNSPVGVAVDALGVLWVADAGNERIRTLTAPNGGAIAAPPGASTLSAITVVNAASMAAGPIASNEIVTIFGTGFDATQTQVLFDGKVATIFYSGATQLNVLTPAGLLAGANSELTILVKGVQVADSIVPVVTAAPAIFAAQGTGDAAAPNEDGSLNSTDNPAIRGSIATFYATGWTAAGGGVAVTIGGYDSALLFAGPAPGYAGLQQINVRVPGGFLPPGNQPVAVSVGAAVSQSGITLAIR